MNMTHGNTAYDLSRFEPKEERSSAPKRRRKPKYRLRHDVPRVLAMLTVMAAAIGIFGFMLYSHVQITELSDQISSAKSDLSQAQSEYDYLNMQVQSKTSLANVEDYARNVLGMKKLDNYQVEYITIKGEAPVETSQDQEGSFWDSIVRAVSDLLS
ncbi:MAG: hypothetical protein HFE85_03755 [Clostridiales bacterium]|nr:hypothetical protein [Clostridiales bacterium]